MGLFSRKESGAQSGRSRPMISSEAQAAELRGRARRRLVGAMALVLAAVVILPMVLNPEPDQVATDLPIRMPDAQTPYSPAVNSPLNQPDLSGVNSPATVVPDAPVGIPPAPPPLESGSPNTAINGGASVGTPIPPVPQSSQPSPQPVTPIAQPKPKPEPTIPPVRNEPRTRSDDGERALALLEGREPSPAKPVPRAVEKGNFVLQIAAYTARADADSRREKLHAAGVTNAFVQPATISGKEQFRLRVGPFPSRDAAQAAQARLRTLGYDNGFIAAQ